MKLFKLSSGIILNLDHVRSIKSEINRDTIFYTAEGVYHTDSRSITEIEQEIQKL